MENVDNYLIFNDVMVIKKKHLCENSTITKSLTPYFSKGKKVVCYFSAGTYEDWRPDKGQFPPDALGNEDPIWRGERWVDIRDTRSGVRLSS